MWQAAMNATLNHTLNCWESECTSTRKSRLFHVKNHSTRRHPVKLHRREQGVLHYVWWAFKMSFVTSFADRNYHFIVFIVRRRGFIMMWSPRLINERNLHYISATINTPSLLTHRPPINKHTKIHLVSSPTAMKHHHGDRALMLKHRVTSSNMAGLDGMIRGLPWSY